MTAWRYYSYLLCKRKQPSLATWLKGWLLAPHLLQTRRCRTVHRTVGLENERKKKNDDGKRTKRMEKRNDIDTQLNHRPAWFKHLPGRAQANTKFEQ